MVSRAVAVGDVEERPSSELRHMKQISPSRLRKVVLPQFWGGRATRSRQLGELSRLEMDGLVFRYQGVDLQDSNDWIV